jgi:hypothetical protein
MTEDEAIIDKLELSDYEIRDEERATSHIAYSISIFIEELAHLKLAVSTKSNVAYLNEIIADLPDPEAVRETMLANLETEKDKT